MEFITGFAAVWEEPSRAPAHVLKQPTPGQHPGHLRRAGAVRPPVRVAFGPQRTFSPDPATIGPHRLLPRRRVRQTANPVFSVPFRSTGLVLWSPLPLQPWCLHPACKTGPSVIRPFLVETQSIRRGSEPHSKGSVRDGLRIPAPFRHGPKLYQHGPMLYRFVQPKGL